MLKGIQVFEGWTGFGFVAVGIGVSSEQFWYVAQQVEVHGGIGGGFGAEAVEVKGIFEEGFKAFDGAAHALRFVEEYADGGAQCAAGTAFVVDFAPVFGVCTAG